MTINDGAITGQKFTKNRSWIPWTVAGILAVLALIFGVVSSNLSKAVDEHETNARVQQERIDDLNNNVAEAFEEREVAVREKERIELAFAGCEDLSESADTYVATLEETVVVSLTLVEDLANLDEAGVTRAGQDLERINQTLEDERLAFESALNKCDVTEGTSA